MTSIRRGGPGVRAVLGLTIVASIVVGCAGFTSDPALTLGLDNGTDRPVLLYANDEWVGTFPVGAERDDITTSAHGGPPWRIEARTDRGTVLASFDAASDAALPTGVASATACGELAVWAGDERPASLGSAEGVAPCE
jgi:hypothetical protein